MHPRILRTNLMHRQVISRALSIVTTALIFAVLSADAMDGRATGANSSEHTFADLLADQRNFFSRDSLYRLGMVFGGGAVMANTPMDQRIQDYYQDRIRNSGTDSFSKNAKQLGEGKYLIPLSVTLASLSFVAPDSRLGEFGMRTARAYLVGGIPLLALQRATGAGRPGEYRCGSRWRPLHDSNGVSGHAFIGAAPFLVLADMSDRPLLAYAAYVASAATAFSRINDDDHYLSQAVLGWHIAYEATRAVAKPRPSGRMELVPSLRGGHVGIMATVAW